MLQVRPKTGEECAFGLVRDGVAKEDLDSRLFAHLLPPVEATLITA